MPFSKISGVEEVYKYLLEKNILLDRFGLWGLVSQETNVHATQNAISAGHGTTEAERNTELTAVSNVKIYDSRRVKITKSDLNPDGYFDASFLSVPEVNCKYIMTGIPIPSQVPYFWQMVVEQKVPVIVKLTPTIHHEKEYTYFPKQENHMLRCGRYQVKCLKKKSYPSHSYRVLRVSIVSGRDQGHQHDIAHLTLSKWPHEKKFPVADMKQFWQYYTYLTASQTEGKIEKLRKTFSSLLHRQLHSPTSHAPIIQCDLGQMRSASFILVDIVMRMIELKVKGCYSPEAIFVKMRDQNNHLKIPPDTMKDIYYCLLTHLRELEPTLERFDGVIQKHAMSIPEHDWSKKRIKKYIIPKQWIVDKKERDRFIKQVMKTAKRDSTLSLTSTEIQLPPNTN